MVEPVTLKIGDIPTGQKIDGGTEGLVSGFLNITKLGIDIKGTDITITAGNDPVSWKTERPQIIDEIDAFCKTHKIKNKKKLSAFLAILLAALSSSNKYNLKTILDLLKKTGLSLEMIAKLIEKDLSGNELIEALLQELGLDPRQFEKEGLGKAFQDLETLLTKPDVTSEKIKANAAYQAAVENSFQGLLSSENHTILREAEQKVATLSTAEAQTAKTQELTELSATITQATTLAELKDIYQENKGLIDKNPDLKNAISAQVVVIIRNSEKLILAADFDPLASLVKPEHLGKEEYLITFVNPKGKNQLVLVKKDARKWSFVSKVKKERYYFIREDDYGQPIVKSEVGTPDPKFKTRVLLENAAAYTRPRFVRAASKENTRVLYVPETGVFVKWIDTDKDGKLDREERSSVRLFIDNGNNKLDKNDTKVKTYGISTRLFRAMDNMMDADGTWGDNELDQAELKQALSVMTKYANIMGWSLSKSISVYNVSVLGNDNLDAMEKEAARIKEIRIEVQKAPPDNQRAILERYKFDSYIIGIFLDHLDNAEVVLMRYAAAAYTGKYDLYEVDGDLMDDLDSFNPERITQRTLRAWFEGEEVEEASRNKSHRGGKITSRPTAEQKLRDASGDPNKIIAWWKDLDPKFKKDPEFLKAISTAYLSKGNRAAEKGRTGVAEKYFTRALKYAQKPKDIQSDQILRELCGIASKWELYDLAYKSLSAINNDQYKRQALEELFEKLLGQGNLEQAYKIANESPGENHGKLARIAAKYIEKYLEDGTEAYKDKALAILENEIKPTATFTDQDKQAAISDFNALEIRVKQDATAADLLKIVTRKLRSHRELLQLERTLYHYDNQNVVRLKDTAKEPEIIRAAIADLDKIIASSDYSNYDKAQALLLKGRLQIDLYGVDSGEGVRNLNSLGLAHFEAQRSLRLAYEFFKLAEDSENLDYFNKRREVIFWMSENIRSIAASKDGADIPGARDNTKEAIVFQLLRFIPPDLSFEIRTYAPDSASANHPIGDITGMDSDYKYDDVEHFIQTFCFSGNVRRGRKMIIKDNLLSTTDEVQDAKYKAKTVRSGSGSKGNSGKTEKKAKGQGIDVDNKGFEAEDSDDGDLGI